MNNQKINTHKVKYIRSSLNENDWKINSKALIIKCLTNAICIKTDIDTFFIEANEFLYLHSNIPYICFTNLESSELEITEIPYPNSDATQSITTHDMVVELINTKLPYAFKIDNSNTANREITVLLNELINSLNSSYNIDYLLGISSLYKVLYYSINYYNGKTFTCYDARDNDNNLNKMLFYITKNYLQAISLADIYKICDLGERQCLRLFSDKLGVSPNQLIIIKRLLKSENLLKSHKQYTIKRVGALSGFNSPSYFNKTFKNVFGCTPMTYKEADSIIKQPNDPMAALLNFFD